MPHSTISSTIHTQSTAYLRTTSSLLTYAVDSYEFSLLSDGITQTQLTGGVAAGGQTVEFKPHFHEWATVQPGMVCLARKKRTAVFRQYVAAETAVPVIACAACLPAGDEKNYFFAGVARSKSVRNPDDGIGEWFACTNQYFCFRERPFCSTSLT